MRMESVTVLKPHPYGKEMRTPGMVREIEAKHAPILEKMGLIARQFNPVVKCPIAIQAIELEQEEESKKLGRKRKAYRRMDLRVED